MEEDSSLLKDSFQRFIEEHPNPPAAFGTGNTFIDNFNASEHAKERVEAPFYPFRSKDEWEHARFLLNSSLSQAEVSEYLKLGHVNLSPLFSSKQKHLCYKLFF
jgi:hypothetical protein